MCSKRRTQSTQLFLHQSPHMLVFLILVFWSQQVISTNDMNCGCGSWTNDLDYILDSARHDHSRKILCCIPGVNEDTNATISWTFRGEPVEQNNANNFEKRCNDRILYLLRANVSGNYTCSTAKKDGTTSAFTTSLTVYPSEKFLEKPTMITVSKDVYALEGERAKFTCQAIVGEASETMEKPYVLWLQISLNGTTTFPEDVQESTTMVNENVIKGTIEINPVKEKHYGTYLCKIFNSYGASKINTTLIHGVSPSMKSLNDQKLYLLVGLIITVTAFWLLYCWWRCRWTLVTFYKEMISDTAIEVGYLYDIFIVHGELTSNWVREVLLPTLESTYGYACFVPDRDMLGGKQYADAISQAMSKCRRVLVVITPCLLQSQWAKWALHQGISTCLTTQAHILAITLQEFGNNMVTSENTGLLKTLQMIKRIKVPRSCGLKTIGEEPQIPNGRLKSTNNICQKSDLNLSVPESMIEDCGSNSPKNQRLSNMITGSNNASCEKLDEENECKFNAQKSITDSAAIYIDSNGFDDPGTPCSITPFILPSCKKSQFTEEHQETCGSAIRCVSNTCCGDPEILFWQKVRARLDPPAVRKRHITTKTIA